MTAIFAPEGPPLRATEHAGGPWSPEMLQGSATTTPMTRDVERLADASGFAVRRLTFDLWRPAGLRAFGLATDMLRDGRKALRRPEPPNSQIQSSRPTSSLVRIPESSRPCYRAGIATPLRTLDYR